MDITSEHSVTFPVPLVIAYMDPHHSSVLPKVTVPQAFGIIVCQPVMVLFVAEYIFAPFYLLLHLFLQYVLSITFFFFAAITCPSLPIPKHGQKVGCIDPVWEPYDTHCSFACQAGYSLLGSSVRRCLQNSTWSGVASSCQGKEPKGPYAQETRHPSSSR